MEISGSASPQAVRKLLALSEPNKTRPHQPRQPPVPIGIGTNQPSPAVRRAPSATGTSNLSAQNFQLQSNSITKSKDPRKKFVK